jgi:hypothetical protein
MTFSMGFTVLDPERLPGEMGTDDVAEELDDVVWAAIKEWYDRRGKDLLACEPT